MLIRDRFEIDHVPVSKVNGYLALTAVTFDPSKLLLQNSRVCFFAGQKCVVYVLYLVRANSLTLTAAGELLSCRRCNLDQSTQHEA